MFWATNPRLVRHEVAYVAVVQPVLRWRRNRQLKRRVIWLVLEEMNS